MLERRWRRAAGMLALGILLFAGPSAAQQSNRVLPKSTDAREPFEQDFDRKRSNPYGLRQSNQPIDKTQIETFVKDLGGLPEGKLEESELEEVLKSFQRKYKVFIPDYDVLSTSGLDRKGLIGALQQSLLKSNTSSVNIDPVYLSPYGVPLGRWDELTRQAKDIIAMEIKEGTFFQYQLAAGRSIQPGLTDGTNAYDDIPGRGNLFDPSGNQKTRAFPENMQNPQVIGGADLPPGGMKIPDMDDFYQFGPDFNDLDRQRRSSYPNGRPCFDAQGNEIYPNGKRRYSDDGTPLYSNGRPRIDANGNKLHSNGRHKFSGDGRPLYANGQPRKTSSGVVLFRNGKRRWTDDGLGPDALPMAEKDSQRAGVDFNMPSDSPSAGASSQSVPERNAIYRDERGPEVQEPNKAAPDADPESYTFAKQMYASGQRKETDGDVKLQPNARRQFTGDGVGESTFLNEIDSQRDKTAFVKELYKNGKSAFTSDGRRLYSSGARRSNDQGDFTYENRRTLANAAGQALNPNAEGISGTRGFFGRPQGKYKVYLVIEGTLVRTDGSELVLKPRGQNNQVPLPISGAQVLHDGPDGSALGDSAKLAPRMPVRLVTLSNQTFVDGKLVEEDDPQVVAIFTPDPKVRQPERTEGRDDLWTVLEGRAIRLTDDRLTLAVGKDNREVVVAVDKGTILERLKGGTLVPGDVRALIGGAKVTVVAGQATSYAPGRQPQRETPRAAAVIESF